MKDPNPARRAAPPQRINKSAMRRATAINAGTPPLRSLPPELATLITAYTPDGVASDAWAAVRTTFVETMLRSSVGGAKGLVKYRQALAPYLVWRHITGQSTTLEAALNRVGVNAWYSALIAGTASLGRGPVGANTANDYRSRLMRLVREANPTPDNIKAPSAGHVSVRPPYSDVEIESICRIAARQHNPRVRRQLCAIVGLGAGAGLDSYDMRDLYRHHIDDLGEAGIRVNVAGPRPRVVFVRRKFEDLVRLGIHDLGPTQLILGTNTERRNVAAAVIEDMTMSPECPHIEASRLRTSWLAWLMVNSVPIAVILRAAGLESARTLTDIAKYIPQPDQADIDSFLRDPERWRP